MGFCDPSGRTFAWLRGDPRWTLKRVHLTEETRVETGLVSMTCPYGSFVTIYVSRWRRSAFSSTRSCRPRTCRRRRSTCSVASGSRPTGWSSCSAARRPTQPEISVVDLADAVEGPCLATPVGGAVRRHLRQGGRDRRPRGPRRAETDGVEPHGQRQEGGGPRRDGRGARRQAPSTMPCWRSPTADQVSAGCPRSRAMAWWASGGSRSVSGETSASARRPSGAHW